MSIVSPVDEYFRRARIAFHNGDWEDCEQALRALAVRPEERAFALYNLSILHAQLHRSDWKELYYEALAIRPRLLAEIGERTLLKPTSEVDRRLRDSLRDDLDADEVTLL